MNFLAIDTSSNACSVAVQADDRIENRHVVEARAHTRILIPMIGELLAECKLDVADLDAVILGNGPGSFIGVRIGASVAQGLCFGASLKIVPVSSLATVAAEVFASCSSKYVAIAQDARMGEMYFAQYERGSDGVPALIEGESIVTSKEIRLLHASTTIAGGGWDRYPESIENNREYIDFRSDVAYPNACALLGLGTAAFATGSGLPPEQLVPAYLRNKVAEIPGR